MYFSGLFFPLLLFLLFSFCWLPGALSLYFTEYMCEYLFYFPIFSTFVLISHHMLPCIALSIRIGTFYRCLNNYAFSLSPVFHSPFPRHVLLNVYFYSQFTLNSRINAVLPSFFVFRFSPNLFISFFLSVLLLLTHSLTQSVSVSLSLSLCVELLSLKFTFRFSVTEVKTITTRKIINSFILIVLLTE